MLPGMDTLNANISGTTRTETLNGREYIVAPMTLIVPGVLNGSGGELYYPPDEVSSNGGMWNAIPLVVYHPKKNGKHVSARSPQVLSESGIGYVFNDSISPDGNRVAEGWFDIVRVEAYDRRLEPSHRIMPRLKSGTPIELSTGLFLDRATVVNGKCPKTGRAYKAVARNYRPDHVAILPDEVGACSLKDGCGVLNKASCTTCNRSYVPVPTDPIITTEEPSVNKAQYIDWLITNCDCWKGKDDANRKVLNELDEAKLKALKDSAEQATTNTAKLTETTLALNAANAEIEKLKKVITPTPEPKPETKMTFKEMLANATTDEQAVWNTAVQINERERARIIDALTANCGNDTAKNAAKGVYSKMRTPDLQALLDAAPKPQTTNAQHNSPLYIDGGATHNSTSSFTNLEDDFLPTPTMTFDNPLAGANGKK